VWPVESLSIFRRNMLSLYSEPQNALFISRFRQLPCLDYSSTMKMEVISSFETSVDIQRPTPCPFQKIGLLNVLQFMLRDWTLVLRECNILDWSSRRLQMKRTRR
jgi:hypothetical protein